LGRDAKSKSLYTALIELHPRRPRLVKAVVGLAALAAIRRAGR
jgi:hypothetical protein